jgi:hypothetical protein
MPDPNLWVKTAGMGLLSLLLAACSSHTSATGSQECKDGASQPSCSASNVNQTLTGVLVLNGTGPGVWLGVQYSTGGMTRLILPDGQNISAYSGLMNQKVKVVGSTAPPYLSTPQIRVQSLQADAKP